MWNNLDGDTHTSCDQQQDHFSEALNQAKKSFGTFPGDFVPPEPTISSEGQEDQIK